MRIFRSIIIVIVIVFCVCSNAFAIYCSQCGIKNPDNAKFCSQCGAPLGKSSGVISQLKGHAYVTLGSGESNLQRGMKVYLILATDEFKEKQKLLLTSHSNVQTTTKTILNECESNYGSRGAFMNSQQLGEYLGMLASIEAYIDYCTEANDFFYSNSAKTSTETDVNGAYDFKTVPPGDYYLYARYNTSFDNGYWFVPLSIKKNEGAVLELNNNNLSSEKAIFQYKRMKSLEESLLYTIGLKEGELTKEQLKLHQLEKIEELKRNYYKDIPYPKPISNR